MSDKVVLGACLEDLMGNESFERGRSSGGDELKLK